MGEDARVYATPSMILDIEHTCRELILRHADAGEDSVGIEVAVKHLAATLPGMTVEISVRRSPRSKGRKVTFEVVAKDEIEPISAGTPRALRGRYRQDHRAAQGQGGEARGVAEALRPAARGAPRKRLHS